MFSPFLLSLVLGFLCGPALGAPAENSTDVSDRLDQVAGSGDRLDVEIHYEALCIDSMIFMQTFYAIWAERKEFMNLELLPYGKAIHNRNETTGEWKIECQHGPAECRQNMLHACLLDTAPRLDDALEVIVCAMKSWRANLTECAASASVDLAPVYACADSPRGTELIVGYGNRTRAIQLSSVPSIVADKVFVWEDQRDWVRRFGETFCRSYETKFGVRLDHC